ncbi:MAG TPA: hypothetical protein DCZ72_02015 [Armatimonadetes bacterium]|nr:hypothetical protein [Armatimonadota bacterium]
MSAPRPVNPERRAILIEDIINLSSLVALMLLMFTYTRLPIGVRNVAFALLAVVVISLLIRRKMRIDRLFARMAEEHQRAAGTMGLPPGVPADRLTGPADEAARARAKTGVKRR